MTEQVCPERSQLEQFLLGKLSAEDSQKLDVHFGECNSCLDRAGELIAQDTLTNALADKETLSQIQNSKLREIVERVSESALLKLREQSATSQTFIAPSEETRPNEAKNSALPNGMEFLSPPEADDEIGRLNGYRILKLLGQGGMGMVLLAEDIHLQRKVALKVIKPEIASQKDAKERFLREARTAASLDHDNIVTVYQVGEENGVVFLAMQLLSGESLHDRLKKESQLTLRETIKFAGQIATGLQAAHERGLTHRDIKPDNIWLEAGNDRCKILDFGLARGGDEASQITQSGMIVGTPQYLAPEQAEGKQVDPRADLFSLGVVLYRMLTGKSPFARKSLMATLGAIGNHHPDPPHLLRDDVPESLSLLVMELLEKDPEKRTDSATTFLIKLKQLIADLKSGKARRTRPAGPRNAPSSPEESFSSMTIAPQTLPQAGKRAASGRKTASSGTGIPPKVWWIAGGLAGFLILLGIIVFSFKTKDGEWRLEVYDQDVQVVISQNGEVVEDLLVSAGVQKELTLSVGQYEVKILNAGSEIAISEGVVEVSKAGEVSARLTKVSSVASNPTRGGPDAAGSSSLPKRYALKFDGTQGVYADVPSLRDLGETYTMEGWVTPLEEKDGDIVNLQNKVIKHSVRVSSYGDEFGFRSARVNLAEGSARAFPTHKILAGQRVHFAVSWDGRNCVIWINGVKQRTWNYEAKDVTGSGYEKIWIGGSRSTRGNEFHGLIETLRLSRGVVYSNDFTPPNRFVEEESTIALYHMDEGQGGKLTDSSKNGHHGNIYGAEWVELDPVTFEPKGVTDSEEEKQPKAFALRFDGKHKDIVKIPTLGDLGDEFTIEGWIAPELMDADKQSFLIRTKQQTQDTYIHIATFNEFGLRARNAQESEAKSIQSPLQPSHRVHFAAIWTKSSWQLFLDGILLSSRNSIVGANMPEDKPRTFIGALPGIAEGDTNIAYTGLVETLRFSKGNPYKFKGQITPLNRFEKDENTIALYHMDEGQGDTLTDSSGNGHHGSISGAKWVELDPETFEPKEQSPTPNYALNFPQKGAHVSVDTLRIPQTDCTIESWFRFRENQWEDAAYPQTLFSGHRNGLSFILNASEISENWQNPKLTLEFQHNDRLIRRTCRLGDTSDWNHVAICCQKEDVFLFCNGLRMVMKEEKNQPTQRTANESHILIGSGQRWDSELRTLFQTNEFRGYISEVRVSHTIRYQDSFTPQRSLASDENTLALYHMDEGDGGKLTDSSGNGHHGNIFDANWVELDPVTFEPKGMKAPSAGTVIPKHALRFMDENTGVRTDSFQEPDGPYTVDAWFTRRSTGKWGVLSAFYNPPNSLHISLEKKNIDGRQHEDILFASRRIGDEKDFEVIYPVSIPLDQLTHVSVSWTGDDLLMFVNGIKQVGTTQITEGRKPYSQKEMKLGGYGADHFKSNFTGDIEEYRVSRGVRHTENFVPPRHYENDSDTLLLYNFDFGEGNVLRDASGNGHHGKIFNARWVDANPQTFEPKESDESKKAMEPEKGTPEPKRTSSRRKRPKPASAPFTADEAKQLQKDWAEYLDVEVEYTNPLGMKFVLIPPGEFEMGTEQKQLEYLIGLAKQHGEGWEPEHFATEFPARRVKISKPFYMSVHEVTKYAWVYFSTAKIADRDTKPPAPGPGDDFPATNVTYEEIVEFCKWFSTGEKKVCRLPTEAEWEYACRAGTETFTAFGDDLSSTQANFHGGHPLGNADKGPNLGKSTPVGTFAPNAFGLYDMHGNAWEVVNDFWHENTYRLSPNADPTGPIQGSKRVIRGGDYENSRGFAVRSALRFTYALPYPSIGFRVILELD